MQGKHIWNVTVKEMTINPSTKTLLVYTDKHDAAKASKKGLSWARKRRAQYMSPRVVGVEYVGQVNI